MKGVHEIWSNNGIVLLSFVANQVDKETVVFLLVMFV